MEEPVNSIEVKLPFDVVSAMEKLVKDDAYIIPIGENENMAVILRMPTEIEGSDGKEKTFRYSILNPQIGYGKIELSEEQSKIFIIATTEAQEKSPGNHVGVYSDGENSFKLYTGQETWPVNCNTDISDLKEAIQINSSPV